jgi:hypothetical protein
LGDEECGCRHKINLSISHSLYALWYKDGIKGRKTYSVQEVIVGAECRNLSGMCENYFLSLK